jgi:hypothetical protein
MGLQTLVNIVQMSADSKIFNRPPFHGILGACLCFTNPVDFANTYDEFFDSYFRKKKWVRGKGVYSGSDMSRIFERDRAGFLDFLESFVTTVGQNPNVILNLVWTTLSVDKLPNGVQYYGVGRSAVKNVDPNKFLDDLSQYYPYISVWKVATTGGIVNTVVLVDDLQGEVTQAWNELFSKNRIWIIPNGDLCDPTISAADLCIRYFDEKLYAIRGGLRAEDIKKICDAIKVSAHIHYVGHGDLKYIVPIEQRKVPHHICYKRPMVFILKEQIMPSEVEYIKKRGEILVEIEKFAHTIRSGYKFIDYSKDYQYLKDGDHLIYLGLHGKEQVDFLKVSLGWKIIDHSLSDVLRQSKT